ncbi:MAG: class I SAM-dependent methyltransferase [Cyclobacteriaceae bacterium]
MHEEIAFEKYRKRGAYHWQNYFGSLLKIDCFLRGRYDLVISFLERSGIARSSKVLEVGCGDGALSGLIYQRFGCELTGLEPSPEGIRFCREMFASHHFKGTFEISEGYSFGYPDNHFDFVILADVIEHLQHPDLMLAEMKRVLKVAGKAVITTPIRTSEHPEDKMHVREFYPDELVALCGIYFGKPVESVYSHPVAWHELYSYGKKRNRSLIRLYCRISDKLFGHNVFLQNQSGTRWKNFKQQGLVLEKT